jgi:hypothetical protein
LLALPRACLPLEFFDNRREGRQLRGNVQVLWEAGREVRGLDLGE